MTAEREKLISCIMGAISEHGKLCGPEEIADAILAAGFRLVTPTSEDEVQQAARELREAWAEICKDKLPRIVPASIVCANYILSLAPGKDVVEGARQALGLDKPPRTYRGRGNAAHEREANMQIGAARSALEGRVEHVARFATAHAARERAEYESLIRWLLGEEGDFPTKPVSKGMFYWREELSKRVAAIRARKP